MKKNLKYIISTLIFILTAIILIVYLVNSNISKNKEAIKNKINSYYENLIIDNNELKKFFTNEDIYKELIFSTYSIYNMEDMTDYFKNKAKDYYSYLDKNKKYQVKINDIVLKGKEARVLLEYTYSDCYSPSYYNNLFEKYDLNSNVNVDLFFTDLNELTDKCIKQNKQKTQIVTLTLKKISKEWLINSFNSVMDSEINKDNTILENGYMTKFPEYSKIYSNTNFRLLDFDLEGNNKKVSDNRRFEFDYNKNDKFTLKLEVKGKKGETFNLVVYDENINKVIEKKFTLNKTHQVFEVNINKNKKFNMLQIYLFDSKNTNNNVTISEKSFGRIYIFDK